VESEKVILLEAVSEMVVARDLGRNEGDARTYNYTP
jgi:hypothetical protein